MGLAGRVLWTTPFSRATYFSSLLLCLPSPLPSSWLCPSFAHICHFYSSCQIFCSCPSFSSSSPVCFICIHKAILCVVTTTSMKPTRIGVAYRALYPFKYLKFLLTRYLAVHHRLSRVASWSQPMAEAKKVHVKQNVLHPVVGITRLIFLTW